MHFNKLNGLILITFIYCISCTGPSSSPSDNASQLKKEIQIIDTLLRDPFFAEFMAASLDSAYNVALAQAPPKFLSDSDAVTQQSIKTRDEKVAISLAPFYALECGVALLATSSRETFISWLQKIAKGEAGSDAVLLLNRFANATWKAGQPFRDMERLKRYNFRVSGLLSKEEVDKDSIQMVNAARILLPLMEPASKATQEDQMKLLRTILQDTGMAIKLSYYADSTYAVSQHQPPPSFNTLMQDTTTAKKTVKQVKIATSIAGFYALECGLNYLVTTKHQLPSAILQALVSDSPDKDDTMVFARFANATWKAGQPFRGLDRVTRETFTPFYFLSEPDIDKDVVQIKAAGKLLLARLNVEMQ